MQLASHTLVALMCMLRLKKVRSPCSRSRTSLASVPTSSRFGCSYSATPSSSDSGSPARTLSRMAAKRHGGHLLQRAVGHAFARQQARAAEQRDRFLARQRRVVGVGAQAQRALGDDRREQLVGAEAERHLREARPQRGDVGQHVRDARQRQPAEREAAERVEAERLADGRRHDAERRRRGGGDLGQPIQRSASLSPSLNGSGRFDRPGRPLRARRVRTKNPRPFQTARRAAASRLSGPARTGPGGQRFGRRRGRRESLRSRARSLPSPFPCPSPPAGHQLVGQPDLVEHAPDHGVQ